MIRFPAAVIGVTLCLGVCPLAAEPFSTDAFFAHLDLTRPEMQPVAALVADGDSAAALNLWRDLAVRRMRVRDFGIYGWHSYKGHSRPKTEAKWYCGRATEEELQQWHPDKVGVDGTAVRFTKGNFEYPFPSMVYLFWETGDPHYLDRAFGLMVDFCATSYPRFWEEYRALVGEGRPLPRQLFDELPDWRHNVNALHTGWRLKNIMLVTAGFAKCLGEDRAADWADVMGPRTADPTPAQLDLIDAQWLAQIALSGYEHHASQLLWFCLQSGSVPNQRSTGLKGLSMLWKSFPNFRKADQLGEMIDRAYTEMLENNFLPDGGSLEQSFNYNREDMKGLEEMADFFEGDNLPFVRRMRERAAARRAVNDGLQTPLGSLPQVGNSHHAMGKAVWESDAVAQAYFDAGNHTGVTPVRPQPFLSKAYPYSGFYAMRDGWDLDSRYLFFMNGRSHTGHSMRDALAVQVIAFGRQFAVAAGPPTYGYRHSPDAELADTYLSEASSLKCNTVIVDGKSQAKEQRRYRRAPRTPVAGRWHTSERFDVVDGRYNGGYEVTGNRDSKSVDMSVSHERAVIFVRAAGIWVLVDRLRAADGVAHRYSQVWNFLPYLEDSDVRRSAAGFNEGEFVLDGADRVMSTADPDGPNMTFRHFGPETMTYTKYVGSRDPVLGWLARGIGDAVPAPDVHASWSSEDSGVLLTTLEPRDIGSDGPVAEATAEDEPARGIAGFMMQARDGGLLSARAAETATRLEAAGFSTDATLLLVWQHEGAVAGIVRGGDSLTTPFGEEIGAAGGCFEFWKGRDDTWHAAGIAIPDDAEQDPDATLTPALDMASFPEGRWRLRQPERTSANGLQPGLRWKWARRPTWSRLYDLTEMADIAPMESGLCESLDVTPVDQLGHGHQGALVFDGFLRAPRDGVYTFYVASPNGVRLFLRNPERDLELPAVAECTYVNGRGAGCAALREGWHDLRIAVKRSTHDDPLSIEVEGPGIERCPLPPEWFYRQR